MERMQDIPNVGPRMEEDFRRLGITTPRGLVGKDPLALYRRLERLDGRPHDPCVLDTFMAVTDYMGGAPARPWWKYTAKRKKLAVGGKN